MEMIKKMIKIVIAVALFLPISYTFTKTDTIEQVMQDFIAAEFKHDTIAEINAEKNAVKKNILKQKIWEKLTPKKAREMSLVNRKLLTKREKAEIVATMVQKNNTAILSYDVIKDLEVVKGQSEKSLVSILNELAAPQTIAGKIAFTAQVTNPIVDTHELKNRQDVLKNLLYAKDGFKNIEENIVEFKNVESSLYEFFSGNPMVSDIEKKLVYSRFNVINNSPLLYNLTTAVPAILTICAAPVGLFSVSVVFWRAIAGYIKPGLPNIVEAQINKDKEEGKPPKTREEVEQEIIAKNYTPYSDEKVQEFYKQLESKSSKEKDTARSALQENVFKKLFQRALNDEKISLYDCSILNKDILKLSSLKTLAIWYGVPTAFLSIRQFSEFSIIAQKAKEIQIYLSDIAKNLEIAENLYEIIENNATLKNSSFGLLLEQFINNPELDYLKSHLRRSTFKGNPSTFSNWGRIFATLQEMEKQKDHFIPLIKALGEIDMYVAITNVMSQYASNDVNKVGFCFVDFVENKKTPIINAIEFWNPFVLSHKTLNDIIVNSIKFDGHHGIFTGPNTCGKTTIIIGLMLNAILAQTFGIAAAKQFILTPFDVFNATLTIGTDGAIGDSRFKAEIRQAQYILDIIKKAQLEGKLCFTIQDEIFTGTQDGAPAAYDFLEKLGKYSNNITLLATHFQKLTTLGAPYVNFKINAEVINNNKIVRHYTISQGISDLNIAHILTAQAGLA